jgi:hypothetical protein
LLFDGFGINIIAKQLKLRLGLPRPKPTPYNLKMANQTTTKLVELVYDLKIHVHNIPYITTIIVLQNTVIDISYSILLGRPWLRGARVTHDWGNKHSDHSRIWNGENYSGD